MIRRLFVSRSVSTTTSVGCVSGEVPLRSFGPARRYFLSVNGVRYDSKAIAAAAHSYQFPDQGPLRPDQFSGGLATVVPTLRRMGVDVIDADARDAPSADVRAPVFDLGRVYNWDELGELLGFEPDYLTRAGGMVSCPALGMLMLITHPGGGPHDRLRRLLGWRGSDLHRPRGSTSAAAVRRPHSAGLLRAAPQGGTMHLQAARERDNRAALAAAARRIVDADTTYVYISRHADGTYPPTGRPSRATSCAVRPLRLIPATRASGKATLGN